MATSDKPKKPSRSTAAPRNEAPAEAVTEGATEGGTLGTTDDGLELDAEGFDLIDELFTDGNSEPAAFQDETTGVTSLPDALRDAPVAHEPAHDLDSPPTQRNRQQTQPPPAEPEPEPAFDASFDAAPAAAPVNGSEAPRERTRSAPAELFGGTSRDRVPSSPVDARTRVSTSPAPVGEAPPRERTVTQPPPPPPTAPARDRKASVPAPMPAVTSGPVATGGGGGGDLDDNQSFRAEAQRLGRSRDWQKLAGLTRAAIDVAPWAQQPETKSALLYDLARVHRDRLRDLDMAEQTFRQLTELDAANEDAVEFLAQRYEERGDSKALYDLYGAATEATWDPNRRLEWTHKAVSLATDRLRSDDLAIAAWERLWKLGDGGDEAFLSLSQMYRRAGRWDRLGEFLEHRADEMKGTQRIVALREVTEAYLSGLRDHERADRVLGKIVAERDTDIVALMARARVLARRRSWDELQQLGTRDLHGIRADVAVDLRRVVADALWSAGELERSAEVRNQILAVVPADADSLKAKEEYLAKAGRPADLVAFLAAQAESAKDDEERAVRLGRAAELAERELDEPRQAIALWEKRAECQFGRVETYQALCNLYDQLGDLEGVRRSLEGQLALLRQPAQRIELLRRLGEHCAHRLGDDTRAEACWREVLGLVPDDSTIRDELVALYRRRGDYEALDRTLTGQALRALDDQNIRGYWLAAAQNIDDNFADPERAVRGWLRVLDLGPDDRDAHVALARHRRAIGSVRPLALSLEEVLASSPDSELVERGLEIAGLWKGENDRVAALAAFERVWRWRPTDRETLAAVRELSAAGSAEAAFEAAAAALPPADIEGRLSLLEEAMGLAESQDKQRRFWLLGRLLRLSGNQASRLPPVTAAAAEANVPAAMAALYHELAGEARDPAERARYLRELGQHYEQKLRDPLRALLTLESVGRQPLDDAAITELARLCDLTGRHEELLALYDVQTRYELPVETRRAALKKRATLCERKLGDPERAFYECWRLLSLDPTDAGALADAERLAEAKQLWRPLDALYAELFVRTSADGDGSARRIDLLLRRAKVRGEHLKDATGALDQLLLAYRLQPESTGLTERIAPAADAQKAWDRVLPLYEAEIRHRRTPDTDALVSLAKLYEDKLTHRDRAFELVARAFVNRPAQVELAQRLAELADQTKRHDLLAIVYRLAAARTLDPVQRQELLRKVAALLGDKLARKEEALDVHRRILQLDPTAMASLEVVIDHERQSGMARELVGSLTAWADAAPKDDARRIPRLLEIAELSAKKLNDPERALQIFADVLDLDPTNTAALEGVRSLTAGPMEPALELRRLRIELGRTTGARRAELLLQMAKLEEDELDDVDAALRTLDTLSKETGAAGPAYPHEERILRRLRRFGDLVDRMTARAQLLTGEERIAALREAIEVCETENVGAERYATLARLLAETLPDDRDAQHRLLAVYRGRGDHELLSDLLKKLVARPQPGAAAERERRVLADELCFVLDRALKKHAEAESLWLDERKKRSDSLTLVWSLAGIKLRSGDFQQYLVLREDEAKKLPPVLGALVLCHLAEACDERGMEQKVAGYYRSARTLDAANLPAIEALKAIGRRAKGWRAQAALLTDADEAKLSFAERAERLRERASTTADIAQKTNLYQRAVAIDPDSFRAWDGLAELAADQNELEKAVEYRSYALHAWERTHFDGPVGEHASRIVDLSDALQKNDRKEEADELTRRAHELEPTHPAAALAVAEQELAAGDATSAYALYDRVLRLAQPAPKQRLLATYRRGELAARVGKGEQAIADLREGLRIDPLHPGVLNALADALAAQGRYAAAVQHYTQALLLAEGKEARGQLYGKAGRLWDDQLDNPDEAGVSYDLAIAAGLTELDLMLRALRYYRRSGQQSRALEVIDRLLPGTTAAGELAALWTERGGILAATDEEKAIEAFDMALSYDPGNTLAITGLAEVLERRGDWAQLRDIFEARADSGGPRERAEAYRQLARISSEHLKDEAASERYLKQAIGLDPRRDDLEHLLKLYGKDVSRFADRREVLSGLVKIGRPRIPRLAELGRMVAEQGDRRWGWCLLSILMNATITDSQLKALVLELRKELEKSDHIQALSSSTAEMASRDLGIAAVIAALAEIDHKVGLGAANPDALGAQGLSKLDARTAVGKTWAQVAERLGIDNAILMRASELDATFQFTDPEGDAPGSAIVKSEFMQLMPAAEIQFFFTYLLELGRPGARLTKILSSATLEELCAVLLDPTQKSFIADQLRANLPGEDFLRIAAPFRELAQKVGPAALAKTIVDGASDAALRVALVGAPDLRAAARVVTRLDDALPKLQTSGTFDDLEEFLDHVPALARLVGFAVSGDFANLLG